MGIQLMILAGVCVAAANLCFRKSVDKGGTTKAYLLIQLFLTFFVAILLGPVRTEAYGFNGNIACIGIIGGLILGLMLMALGKAFESGPPGLTVATLSSSTVVPILFMVLLFGERFGFIYTFPNGIGSLCVVAGLVWAGWQRSTNRQWTKWMLYALAAFALHALFLIFMQWRALFLNFPGEQTFPIAFTSEQMASQWFMPMIFLAAFSMQAIIYLSTMKRLPTKHEALYGFLGGIAQGVGTYLLIKGTEVATSSEQAMIFPIYTVTILLLCNIWGRLLYNEKVNWLASLLCIIGILIGTTDWSHL
jgi:drug/metabolite transporter (DMT)-like permease